ncbi:MAG: hypothetical protein ABSG52_00500 [Terriglobales bacterium]|jgi:beta-phosphoglucomutase-like phosphatase (HAD superfamily)
MRTLSCAAILFDLDGVLVESRTAVERVLIKRLPDLCVATANTPGLNRPHAIHLEVQVPVR